MRTWIVVCDKSRARFFMKREGSEEWVKFEEFDHPAGRAKGGDLVTDRPGRSFQSQGHDKRAATDSRTDPREVEHQRFAHYIGDTLNSAHAQNAFERLVLVAPPQFLGLLRQELEDRVQRCVFATLDKDYAQLDEQQLAERITLP